MDYEIYYWSRDIEENYILKTEDTVCQMVYDSNREGDAEMELHEHSAIQRVKRQGNYWVLHCLTAPAFVVNDGYKQFYVNGDLMLIEDMPISEEEKVILKLKYF